VDGADFAIGAIGGAGADASRFVSESYYHQADVRIPARYRVQQVIGDTGDPATGEAVVPLICDVVTDRRNVHIVNTANAYGVPNLPPHAVLEVEAVSDSCGLRGVHMDEAPPVLKGMLEKRIAWHEAVADAAVTGDRRLALQALMLDETAIWPVQAREMPEELLRASRDLLPQFAF